VRAHGRASSYRACGSSVSIGQLCGATCAGAGAPKHVTTLVLPSLWRPVVSSRDGPMSGGCEQFRRRTNSLKLPTRIMRGRRACVLSAPRLEVAERPRSPPASCNANVKRYRCQRSQYRTIERRTWSLPSCSKLSKRVNRARAGGPSRLARGRCPRLRRRAATGRAGARWWVAAGSCTLLPSCQDGILCCC